MALFMGLELAVDQLRATVVDEQLEIVQTHAVDFDAELGYGTRGGMLGDSQTAPVEMWIKALEVLLGHLSTRVDMSKVRCISGSAMQSTVLWTAESLPALAHLNPSRPLHQQLSSTFALPASPLPTCTLSLPHAQAIESLLGGAHTMASLVGTSASPSLPAALLLRLRETQPDTWRATVRAMPASALLATVLMGKWAPSSEGEVVGSGMWNARTGTWEGRVVDILASGGGQPEVDRVRRVLGEVERSGAARIGTVAPFFVQRFGFNPDCAITPFTSDHLSTYLSLAPLPTDAILSFGAQDVLLAAVPPAAYSAQQPNPTQPLQSQSPAPTPTANPSYILLPHPAQHPLDSPRRYIAQHIKRNADVPRALVRDMYTKSWSAFDRLVDVVPPGGSIGLDDKLFSFWLLSPDSYPLTHTKGIFRFETGVKVNEFRDLRANPRTLIEGQIVSMRVGWARVVETLGYSRNLLSPTSVPGNYFSSSASHYGGYVADPWGQGGAGVGGGGGLLRPGVGLGIRTPTRTGGNSPTSAGSPRGGSPLQRTAIAGGLQHRTSVHAVPLLPGVKNPTISSPSTTSFDPYDPSRLPPRIIVLGSCAAFPSVVNLVGEIFNAAVFVVGDDSASSLAVRASGSPATTSPAQPYPSHAQQPPQAGGVSGLLNHHSIGPGGLATPGGGALSAALFSPSNLSLSQHIGPMTPGSAHLGPVTPGGTLLAQHLQGGVLGVPDPQAQSPAQPQPPQPQAGAATNSAATAPRASLGAAFLARWAWKRTAGGGTTTPGRVGGTHSPSRYGGSSTPHSKSPSPSPPSSFEEDTRALIAARWVAREKRERWLAQQKEKEEEVTVNIMTPVGGRGRSASAPGFAPAIGSLGPLHPHPHHHARSGLQAEAFAEEEEDEALALEALQAQLGEGAGAELAAAAAAHSGMRGRSATTTAGWGGGPVGVGGAAGSYAAAAAGAGAGGPQTPGGQQGPNGYYASPSTTATSPSTAGGATASPATTAVTTPGGFSAYGSPNPLLAGQGQGPQQAGPGYTGLGIQGMMGGGGGYAQQGGFSPFAAGGPGGGGYMNPGAPGAGGPGAPPGLQPLLQPPQQGGPQSLNQLLPPLQAPPSSSSLLPPQASFSPTSPPTPLPLPQSLPTDDVDKVMGLVKVAEADHDAFMGYAAVVGEWCRLESMLVRGIV